MGLSQEVQKVSARAKASLERIDDAEKELQSQSKRLEALEKALEAQNESVKQIVTAANATFSQLHRAVEVSNEMLNSVIGILGPAQVQDEIERNRKLALDNQVAESKAGIAKALESGDLVVAEKASEKSFVAGVEVKADGVAVPPGWAFVPMTKIEEEFRTQLIGQSVGFKVQTKEGGHFELLEIYEPVEKKAEAAAPV